MGRMVDGQWHDVWHDTGKTGGQYERQASVVRNWITKDGAPGPSGRGGFTAQPGRYHLYVCLACPWAHRTLIARRLKGLDDVISVDIVHPYMREEGWHFGTDFPRATGDTVNGRQRLWEVYKLVDAHYTGRVTVPLLWDKEQGTAVNNESSEIIRMLNTAFEGGGARGPDLYPAALRAEIDRINARVYSDVNNGVYRCGFATTQAAYEDAYVTLFAALDWLEELLSQRRYLAGSPQPTEADWRLFATLIRFDCVYVGHFKCNKKRIVDYPALSGYLRDLYQTPGIAETCDVMHYKHHYYGSHKTINPTLIVPRGPDLDLDAAHERDRVPL